jgi:hypothetical protein
MEESSKENSKLEAKKNIKNRSLSKAKEEEFSTFSGL